MLSDQAVLIASYLAAVNLLACILFGVDKFNASRGTWRISERKLLVAALAGGSPGAFAGRALFRHKTRKHSFVLWLRLIITAQGLVLLSVAGYAFGREYI